MPEAIYGIGSIVPHKNEAWRVVRIITKSETLFEPEDGREPAYVAVESYVELKGADGMIDFVVLSQEKKKYEGGASIIKGLEPVLWVGAR
jgi:hypothetical protein